MKLATVIVGTVTGIALGVVTLGFQSTTAPTPVSPSATPRGTWADGWSEACMTAWTTEKISEPQYDACVAPLDILDPDTGPEPLETGDPNQPPPLIAPEVQEDSPDWDCLTMGNRECGPTATFCGYPTATLTREQYLACVKP